MKGRMFHIVNENIPTWTPCSRGCTLWMKICVLH